MADLKVGDKIQLKFPSKMDYYGDTCKDILDIFKGKEKDSTKIEWFEKLFNVLEAWYKENENEAVQ